jgi:hypothetical protein
MMPSSLVLVKRRRSAKCAVFVKRNEGGARIEFPVYDRTVFNLHIIFLLMTNDRIANGPRSSVARVPIE